MTQHDSRQPAPTPTDIAEALKPIQRLGELFAQAGHPIYLVGGSVRDLYLGRLGTDYDLTTPARPETTEQILQKYCNTVWDTGIRYGTISGERDGLQIEITTFRSDNYDGITRNPDVQYGDTLEGDLIRRDFTCNALALDLNTHQLHDPLNGLQALKDHLLDTPQPPQVSFNDDPLRMLRAARFTSQLGFTVTPRVHKAMTTMAQEINRISTERITTELNKLITGNHPEQGIDLLVTTGLANHIIPEIPALQLTPDEHHQHKDVYAHSLTVLRQAIDQETQGPDLILRWAALLHDIGKPNTRSTKPGGGVTFHQHEVEGAKLTRRRLRALKFPKQHIKDISQLVYLHMRFYGYSDNQWTDSAVRRYVNDAEHLLDKLNTIVRADVTTRNKKKATRLRKAMDNLETRIEELKQQEDLAKVRPDLDGNAIMNILGLPPGPHIGKAWNHLKELRLENGPMTPEEAEAALLTWYEQEFK